MTVSVPAELQGMSQAVAEKQNITRLIVAARRYRLHRRVGAAILPDVGLRPQPRYPDDHPSNFRRLAPGVTDWSSRPQPPRASCDGRAFGP